MEKTGQLPVTFGNTPTKRIVNFYSKVFHKRFGFYPRVLYPRIGGLYKSVLNEFTEYQVALMVLLHFEWRGSDGRDEFIHKRLADNVYPLEWLPRNINAYQAFIRNTLNIKFDDLTEVEKYVIETLHTFK